MTKVSSTNSVRIIGGDLRSRKVEFPSLPGLRPSADRVRETLFNWLQSEIRGKRCLDLFAGSGVLGFEAASRGAREALLLEQHPLAVSSLRSNAAKLNLDNISIFQADSLNWLSSPGAIEPFDIVFVDPPFSQNLLPEVCELLQSSGVLQQPARIYLESAEPISADNLPAGWQIKKTSKAGQVHFCLVMSDR